MIQTVGRITQPAVALLPQHGKLTVEHYSSGSDQSDNLNLLDHTTVGSFGPDQQRDTVMLNE